MNNQANEITDGCLRIFNYPDELTTLPEYSAHRGQTVEVIRQLSKGENTSDQPMYEIKASDGWVGHADEWELIAKHSV